MATQDQQLTNKLRRLVGGSVASTRWRRHYSRVHAAHAHRLPTILQSLPAARPRRPRRRRPHPPYAREHRPRPVGTRFSGAAIPRFRCSPPRASCGAGGMTRAVSWRRHFGGTSRISSSNAPVRSATPIARPTDEVLEKFGTEPFAAPAPARALTCVALKVRAERDHVASLEAATAERAEEVRVAVRVAGGAEHDREFSARALGGRRVGAWRGRAAVPDGRAEEELAV